MKIGKTKPILAGALVVLTAITLLLVLKDGRVEEGRCKLVCRKADPSSQLLGFAYQLLMPQADRPEDMARLPAGFDRPACYLVRSAGRQVPLIVNSSEAKPTVCMDLNGDGFLSQDECFAPRRIRATKDSSGSWRFGPIRIVSQERSSEANGGFYVDVYGVDAPGSIMTFPASFRTGKLRLEGRVYRVAVVDGDCDGRFLTPISLPLDHAWRLPDSDVFAIDLNGNDKFEVSWQQQSEAMPMGKMVRVGDVYYAIEVAPDGTSLSLSKTQPQFGTLVVDPNDTTAELNLWSDAAGRYLALGRQWQLPAGRYASVSAAVEKKDNSGGVWQFSWNTASAIGHSEPLDFFVIEPGQTTRLQIGPPFQIKNSVRRSGQTISINAELQGQAGELYSLAATKDGRRPPKAKLQVLDEEGRVLESGKLEYG
jgi:hypothetical protein